MPDFDHRRGRIHDFVNMDWFKNKTNAAVWISLFRIMRVGPETFPDGPKSVDFPGVRAVFLFGRVPYVQQRAVQFRFEKESLILDAKQATPKQSEPGAYLLLITPFRDGPAELPEAEVEQRISAVAGMLGAILGPNIVYERMFDFTLGATSGEFSFYSPMVLNPNASPAPDLADESLERLRAASSALAKAEPRELQRLLLSLHWFEEAIATQGGVDAFIKFWIALEVLAMEKRANIKPLNEALASAYDLSLAEVRERFSVGKLAGLRGRIVHKGQKVSIHADLIDYVSAIFLDVLFQRLGLGCEMRAWRVISRPGFALAELLR